MLFVIKLENFVFLFSIKLEKSSPTCHHSTKKEETFTSLPKIMFEIMFVFLKSNSRFPVDNVRFFCLFSKLSFPVSKAIMFDFFSIFRKKFFQFPNGFTLKVANIIQYRSLSLFMPELHFVCFSQL